TLDLLEYPRPSSVNADYHALPMPLAPPLFDLLPVFNAQPGATLLLSPDWVIVGASDDYLAATLTERASLAERQLRESQAGEQAARAEADQEKANVLRLFEQVTVAIALLQGPDYRVELANPEMLRIWGRTAAQTLNQSVFAVLPEVASQGFETIFADVLQHGTPYDLREVPVQIDRGHTDRPTLGYFHLMYRPQHDALGHITGIITMAVEVTEQVVARQQLELLNQDLEARVQERTPAIAVYDGPEFVFELVNPVYQALLPGRPLLGLPVRDAFPEVTQLPVFDTLQQVYETGITHHEQDQLIPVPGPNGGVPENRYFNFTLQARYDEQHRVDGVVGFGFEVTKQVVTRQQADTLQAELLAAAQQQAAERAAFHAVFEQTPALIALLRAPGHRYEYVNPAYQALFPGRQLVGLDLAVAVPEAQEQGFVTVLDHVYQTGETYFGTELTRTNVDLDNFIYTASHDLKAPISNIEGLLLALEHELPAAGRVGNVPLMLTLMQEAVERFTRTIGHLTDLSRLQKEHTQSGQQVAVAAIIEAVRLDLLPLVHDTQAQLTVDIPAALTLTFSEKNLRSVVYNLLSNALKYRHPDRVPDVHIRYQLLPDFQVLEVQDNGLGLDLAQSQDKLFAMFQRLHTHVEGTGIGLYMVKKIVENAGGRIELVDAGDLLPHTYARNPSRRAKHLPARPARRTDLAGPSTALGCRPARPGQPPPLRRPGRRGHGVREAGRIPRVAKAQNRLHGNDVHGEARGQLPAPDKASRHVVDEAQRPQFLFQPVKGAQGTDFHDAVHVVRGARL
nr:hybrid signal transduction histidine kinase B [Tanacetum cinerariifolium]